MCVPSQAFCLLRHMFRMDQLTEITLACGGAFLGPLKVLRCTMWTLTLRPFAPHVLWWLELYNNHIVEFDLVLKPVS